MTRSLKRVAAVSMLSAVAAGMLAACGGGGGSSLQPSGASTTTSGANSTTSATSGGDVSDRWFSSVQACSMIDQATLTRLGYASPGTVTTNNDFENRCDWTSETSQLTADFAAQAYDTLVPEGSGQISKLTVSGRPAEKEDITNSGVCMLSVEATKNSQALIHVDVLQGSSLGACDIAEQAAAAVEPNLPKLSS
ncbi:MAG TPA: DUF3558 family protein [Pseudonocardiaceae bacterium]